MMKKIVTVTLLVAAGLAAYVALQSPSHESVDSVFPAHERGPNTHPSHPTDIPRATETVQEKKLPDIKEVVQSLDDADRDFREAAIAEAERFVLELDPDGTAISRWQPVRIRADDFLSGDFLDGESMANEFYISPFPDMSFEATMLDKSVDPVNSNAYWQGELDGGGSGSVTISTLMDDAGYPVFYVRMNVNRVHISIVPTKLHEAYVVLQASGYGPTVNN